MEPSIKEVGKLEGEGSKFVEIYLLLEIKICCRHGGWGYFSLNYQRLLWTVHILDIQKNCTGCNSIFRKIFEFKICKDPMIVVKQMRPQQIALDLSFNLAPWKWAWHYHEAATPSHRRTTFFTPRGPMLFAAASLEVFLKDTIIFKVSF